MPSVAFRRIHIGKEAVRGTRVAATRQLLGAFTLQAQEENFIPEDEERNSLALLHRRVSISQHSTMRYTGSAKFEELPFFLNMCMKGLVAGDIKTPTNATNARRIEFTPVLRGEAAARNINRGNHHVSYTFEYGDDQQAYEVGFGLATQLQLAYDARAEVRLTADLFGRYPAKDTFTSGIDLPSKDDLEDLVTLKSELFVDTSWATLGTSKKGTILAAANITIPSGLNMTQYVDGDLDFTNVVETKRAMDFEFTLRHDSEGVAEYDKYVADNPIFIRFVTKGSELDAADSGNTQATPSGAAYTKEFGLDISGIYTEPPEFFGDRDGENIIVLRGRSFEDPTPDPNQEYRAWVQIKNDTNFARDLVRP